MTACKIKRNEAETRAHAMVEGKPARVPFSSQDAEIETSETKNIEFLEFERVAADQIQKVIACKFEGHKLTDIVDVVLRERGYVTQVSSPGQTEELTYSPDRDQWVLRFPPVFVSLIDWLPTAARIERNARCLRRPHTQRPTPPRFNPRIT
jgi:hypothetical protein